MIRTSRLCDGLSDTSAEHVCGRPLGLKFNQATCDLYIADAYFGLLVVGRKGGLARQLATSAEGIPFLFANALDIDQKTGTVYFTDTSTRFRRWYSISFMFSKNKNIKILIISSLISFKDHCNIAWTNKECGKSLQGVWNSDGKRG